MSLENYLKESKAYIEFIKSGYDDHIKLLYGEIQYSNEINKYFKEQYSKDLKEKEQGKLNIVEHNNFYSGTNLAYEFDSYTENYLDVVKHLLGNILNENQIKIPTLEKLLQQIEKSKQEIIDGAIL